MNHLEKYSILVVDDDPSWRETVRETLESYDVVTVSSDTEAMESLLHRREKYFDVAILDKRLIDSDKEDKSGFNLAKKIKNICPNCKIVILTGYSDVSSTRDALVDIQVSDVLEKYPKGGFQPEKLRKVIAEILLTPNFCPLEESRSEVKNMISYSNPIILLHLSDIHFGEHHRFSHDDRLPEKDAPSLHKALCKTLRDINKSPDIIIISGDLTEKADWGEFTKARDFIDSLKNEFDLSANQVIVIPGNHDVRWDHSPESNKFVEYEGFYSLIYRNEENKTNPFCKVEYYDLADKPPIAVVALDSCFIESPENAGIGYIGTGQLDNVFKELEDKAGGIECVKIAVLHHHLVPVNYLEKLPDKDKNQNKNFSLVADAVRVITKLQQNNFSLILHGHQHQAFCTQFKYLVDRNYDSGGLVVMGMGSAGIKPELAGSAKTNYFGLVEINGMENLNFKVSWYRADVNEPEEKFELEREFAIPFIK